MPRESSVLTSRGVMKKQEASEFRDLLEEMQYRLRGDVSQLTKEALGADRQDGGSESKSPTHMAELGSDTFEQDFSLSLAANEQETLTEISAALQRIKDGTFGLCEICTKEGKSPAQSAIPKPRLRAIPYCRTCVDCARKKENVGI
jgi:DnaK suppressor protein